jgi:isoamylase
VMDRWSQIEGLPQPLGCTWLETEQCYNFSLYSRHATGVRLLLYSPRDLVNPVLRIPLNHLIHKSGRIWHCRLPAEKAANARYYAYSVEGPNNPAAEFQAFDPDKVLVDTRCMIFFPPNFQRRASVGRGSNAGKAPLGVLPSSALPFDWGAESEFRHA